MFDIFKELEKNYSVEDIYYKNEQVWAYLRNTYFNHTIKHVTTDYSNSKKENFFKKLYKMINMVNFISYLWVYSF